MPTVWVFHGDGAPYAAGVFATRQQGLDWARRWKASGLLTEYPVGNGAYDLAVELGHFTPTKAHHGSPQHVAGFSPGWTAHVHVQEGEAIS